MKESTLRLILVPSVITLAVTLLRLTGELQGWSRVWFNPSPGGGFAPIGIVWLVFVFGAWFAVKLARDGDVPASPGRTIGLALLAFVLFIGLAVAAVFLLKLPFYGRLLVGFVAAIVTALIPYRSWPSLFRLLLAYAIAARIPVIVIMWFAMAGNWGTHYDGGPPDLPADVGLVAKFFWIGVLPQLISWPAFTIEMGMFSGGIAAALISRRSVAAAETKA